MPMAHKIALALSNDPFSIDGWRVSAAISRVADRWLVSITVDAPDSAHLSQARNQGEVGVDLGVSALTALSTAEVVPGPRAHRASLGRLQRFRAV